jgi:alpha-L-fucosidase
VKANLDFMKQQYGSNLVAFTLHQDEKTPHIHAIVVPITSDNRLCAKELFTPKTLRQLQTDYAGAMKPFGLERGVEGSRAQHVDMKHIYGLQQAQRQEIQQELGPIQQQNEPLHVSKPDVLDLLNLERWRQQQEAQINAEYNRRLAEVQKAAQIAQNAAVANATAKEQGKVLQQRLDTAESLKQANHEKAQKAEQKLAKTTQNIEKIAVLVDEKRLSPQWSQQTAEKVRARILPQLEKDLVKSVQGITTSDVNQAGQQLRQSMEQKGYQFTQTPEGKTSLVIEPKSGVQVNIATEQFEGKLLRELVNQRAEQLKQEELKPKLRQSRGRGLGM